MLSAVFYKGPYEQVYVYSKVSVDVLHPVMQTQSANISTGTWSAFRGNDSVEIRCLHRYFVASCLSSMLFIPRASQYFHSVGVFHTQFLLDPPARAHFLRKTFPVY